MSKPSPTIEMAEVWHMIEDLGRVIHVLQRQEPVETCTYIPEGNCNSLDMSEGGFKDIGFEN